MYNNIFLGAYLLVTSTKIGIFRINYADTRVKVAHCSEVQGKRPSVEFISTFIINLNANVWIGQNIFGPCKSRISVAKVKTISARIIDA